MSQRKGFYLWRHKLGISTIVLLGEVQILIHPFFKEMKDKGILLPPGEQILTQANVDGYLALKELAQLFHPYMMKNPTSIIPSHPSQHGSYSTYRAKTMFFYNLQGWIFDNSFNFGQINYQNMFIVHLHYSTKILEIADKERQSSNPDDTNKYKAGQLFSTIRAFVTNIEHR